MERMTKPTRAATSVRLMLAALCCFCAMASLAFSGFCWGYIVSMNCSICGVVSRSMSVEPQVGRARKGGPRTRAHWRLMAR